MQTQDAIKKRRSARSFSLKPIPLDYIEKIIDCARFAPTARNIQPWEFVAVIKKETLRDLAALVMENGRFIAGSQCCIIVFCQDTKYYLEDGCAATENILVASCDLGLSSCWVAGDKKPYCDKVKGLIGAPQELKLVSLIALGYSDREVSVPPKRTVKEILHLDKW